MTTHQQCMGKADGTSCTLKCRGPGCVPPWSRCCAGRCLRGFAPVDKTTNKADLCSPSSVVQDNLSQCMGRSDGTSCTLPPRFRGGRSRPRRPLFPRCCAGRCLNGRTPVEKISNKADLCPVPAVKDNKLQCKGKPDGTSCALLCRGRDCAPPFTRCCGGKCLITPTCPSSVKVDPLQCKGKPNGTSCTLPRRCRGRRCRPLFPRCCAGRCLNGRTPVEKISNKADLCPVPAVKVDPLQCQGKTDGTSCTQPCRTRYCRPPFTRCCHGACVKRRRIEGQFESCPSTLKGWFPAQCKGKPDGASCVLECRAQSCGPTFSRCCSGHCVEGHEPLHEITNKTEICPR